MIKFDNVLQQLRQEHKQAQVEVDKLEKAISAIEGLNGRNGGNTANGTRPKKTMSAAAKRRIAAAQRARWARFKKQSGNASASSSKPSRRRLSAEGRRRIIAATRARWARVRAQEAKKAA